ncbi:MAG: winged helix-turn-helix transcriptional regulator [Erysipelotrichaceae bacterium]|nr:winged helix-turn-helix transcriptional regulator [Erysipelotrichaceae bacterium]
MDEKKFFYEFGKAVYHIDAVYNDFARESGINSPTLLWILYALNDGEAHTQREICVSWDLPKSTVNTVTMELKAGGYVELAPISGKKREMTLSLTAAGKEYAEKLLSDVYAKEAAVFRKLTAKDKEVIGILEKISTLLRESGGEQNG